MVVQGLLIAAPSPVAEPWRRACRRQESQHMAQQLAPPRRWSPGSAAVGPGLGALRCAGPSQAPGSNPVSPCTGGLGSCSSECGTLPGLGPNPVSPCTGGLGLVLLGMWDPSRPPGQTLCPPALAGDAHLLCHQRRPVICI